MTFGCPRCDRNARKGHGKSVAYAGSRLRGDLAAGKVRLFRPDEISSRPQFSYGMGGRLHAQGSVAGNFSEGSSLAGRLAADISFHAILSLAQCGDQTPAE